MNQGSNSGGADPAAKCVRCCAPVVARFRPFCSQRCAEIDLGNWVSGAYSVAANEEPSVPDDDEAEG